MKTLNNFIVERLKITKNSKIKTLENYIKDKHEFYFVTLPLRRNYFNLALAGKETLIRKLQINECKNITDDYFLCEARMMTLDNKYPSNYEDFYISTSFESLLNNNDFVIAFNITPGFTEWQSVTAPIILFKSKNDAELFLDNFESNNTTYKKKMTNIIINSEVYKYFCEKVWCKGPRP